MAKLENTLAALKAAGISCLPNRQVAEGALRRLTGDQARRAQAELARIVRADFGVRSRRKAMTESSRACARTIRTSPALGEKTGLRASRPETVSERSARESRRNARRMELLLAQAKGKGGQKKAS